MTPYHNFDWLSETLISNQRNLEGFGIKKANSEVSHLNLSKLWYGV